MVCSTVLHVSAGRVPTHLGLRLFVDGLMEVNNLSGREKKAIKANFDERNPDVETVLEQTGSVLSQM